MDAILLVDIGSTYTKVTAVDIDNERILATAKALTTADTDLMIGFNEAYRMLKMELNRVDINFIDRLACSSAAGGLKMVAIGLVSELTSEAAKRAALGAGARLLGTYSYELSVSEIREIELMRPDMILLAGGTDGGNKDCIIHNANLIASYIKNIPVVVAGNKKAVDAVEDIFKKENVPYKIAKNVMPKMNLLDVQPAREAIRQFFMDEIVKAKGMEKIENFIGGILMPTPSAVLKAAKVLADGTDREEGLGDLLVVDIGGATTDIHSIGRGEPSKSNVTVRGLEEPYEKRTVEGDLGMRVSALALWESAGAKLVNNIMQSAEYDAKKRCEYLSQNINTVSKTHDEILFDEALGYAATKISMDRHTGAIEKEYSPMGVIYLQEGKDLQNTKYLIGTGGVLTHSSNPRKILNGGLFCEENPHLLKPKSPEILVDKTYILSAMGLLAEKYPDHAIRILKKHLVRV
ncbi:methylaspartate mutase accessory protein GlmL [Wukongibacter baidiensis]|uniref:methylaspartate mutase accessory protein GlmL n=1 Tax=Wukongibacter baidiensis TaxID=1723361 RepID=UPI003D7FA078